MKKRARRAQAGFTMIEIMITVAILGVLAKLALGSFIGTARKAKADSEISAFFAELRIREEQYQSENGAFLSTSAAETTLFPATPIATGQALGTLPATWTKLKIKPPQTVGVKCSYVAIAGIPAGTPGAMATTNFAYVTPAKNWFYLLARCDMDGSATLDSFYFASSDDPTIKKLNPGK